MIVSSCNVSRNYIPTLFLSIPITGSPKYFSPLLHYLRSGVLEIPPGVSRAALMREADFYGLQIATNEPPKKSKGAADEDRREGGGRNGGELFSEVKHSLFACIH